MKKKTIFLSFLILLLIYPAAFIFKLEQTLVGNSGFQETENILKGFQISIWLSWIVMAIISVVYKWSKKNNSFFYFTYGFMVVAFGLLGFYTQRIITIYSIPSNFEDNYTLGIFTALQHLFVGGILTGFLQVGVWWFTRRWHRRY